MASWSLAETPAEAGVTGNRSPQAGQAAEAKGCNVIKKIWFNIYQNGVWIIKVRGLENAQALVRLYEHQDRYEVDVCKYAIPAGGYPVYTIK